jgi:serine protease
MRKSLIIATVFFVLFALLSPIVQGSEPLFVQECGVVDKGESVPDEIIVGFREGVDVAKATKKVESILGTMIARKGIKNFVVFKIPPHIINAVNRLLLQDPDIEYVEPNYIAYAFDLPNDLYFSPYQWNLYDYGMKSNGYASNYGVQAVSAWKTTTGGGVKVAVVDTGVAYEDYSDSLGTYARAPDLAQTNFDTQDAYDFVDNDAHPNDDNGHGTHVTGTIAQSTNNSLGCAGIAYGATILPIKVLNASGSGTYDAIANGIMWAADHGARVINMSLGGKTGSTTLSNAIKYAYGKGVVIVCASGNDGRPSVSYPAAYTECIAVGSTRFDGNRVRYSNYGSALDLVAPGGDMSVDQNKDGYKDGILQQTFASGKPTSFGYYFFQGTSMASPHVAGVAALVLSVNPAFTNEQVRQALQSTAKDLGTAGRDKYYGYGLVNAALAITYNP